MNKEYIIKDEDELTLNGFQLKEWKKMIIDDYKKSEYQRTIHIKARRKGFIEAVDGLKQWIINEGNLDPEPCCHGVRIINIINKLDEWKQQGDKRFIVDKRHIIFIKQMLEQGYSKNQIAKELQVSIATIVYWTNPRFRQRQLEKNAKKRFNRKVEAIKQDASSKETEVKNGK